MIRLPKRDREKEDASGSEAFQLEERRPPSVSGWLRPLSRAPSTAREIVGRVERIADQSTRAFQSERTGAPPILLSFIAFVLAPSIACILYFAFVATDQYAVETRFAVRAAEPERSEHSSSEKSEGAEAASAGYSSNSQNAYIVTSYIRSRAIVDDLNSRLNLREIFQRPEADFWARLKQNASIDELTDYWNSMVSTSIDAPSGVSTVKIRAFRRSDALAVGNAVLAASENLVNRISDRARRDATAMAEKEVRRSFAAVQAALTALHEFRNKAAIIDPGQTTGEIGKLLIPLMGEKIKIDSELFVAGRELAADAPTIRVLKNRLETVEQQIAGLKAKLTGVDGDDRSIATALVKFEELDIQRIMSERLYMLAQTDLDRAQARANRQSIYLSVFVPPSMPEESRYPRRIAFPLLIFAALAVSWAIVAMTIASVEDHRL